MTAKHVTFNRGDLSSAIDAARRLKSDKDLFIVPTAYGLSIERVKPPVWLKHIIVKPDGTVEEIGMEEKGNPNPMSEIKEPWQMTREEFYARQIKSYQERGDRSPVSPEAAIVAQQLSRDEVTKLYDDYTEINKTDSRVYNSSVIGAYNTIENLRKALVGQALTEGKTVPPEVLKNYPDLTKIRPSSKQAALTAQRMAKEHEERIFKATEAKFAEEAASTETITQREARRRAEKDYPAIGSNPGGNPNPMNDNFAIQEVMQLDLPEPIKQEWLAELESGSAPKATKIKRLSNENGRKAILILWADEHMTAIITDNAGVPFISETSKRDPEAFYLAAAFLQAQGLMVIE